MDNFVMKDILHYKCITETLYMAFFIMRNMYEVNVLHNHIPLKVRI